MGDRSHSDSRASGASVCNHCAGAGHLRRDCPRVQCRGCGLIGHYQDDCPTEMKRARAEGVSNDNSHDRGHRRVDETAVCRSCGSSRHVQASCPVRTQSMECYQCHERGHLMPTCPQTRCFNCGGYGHSSQLCHNEPLCFHCSIAGHVSSDCPMKRKGRLCYTCKEPGHDAAHCPQGVLCRMCSRPGHFIAQCPEALCHRCNERGHIANTCSKGRPRARHAEEDRPPGVWTPPPKANSDGEPEPRSESTPSTVAAEDVEAVPAFVPSATKREGRVAVIIDGSYFERIVKSNNTTTTTTNNNNNNTSGAHYRRIVDALRYTLLFIGEIFEKDPIAYWFDTDPAAFAEYIELSMPLPHRENAFRESTMRRRFLTDEMNGGRQLSNVVARLVGHMKRQRGYTRDGPGHVWVQTGVDVAIATCVIETFLHKKFDQVVLLCGDSDVYPAVHYCHAQRRSVGDLAKTNPVRVCGTSSTISKMYGVDQDLCDFLPRILLDMPSHVEQGNEVSFPTHVLFS